MVDDVGGVPELRFAVGRRGRIAYQQWGDGEDVVGVPPLAQNIEAAWDWPDIVAMFDRFGAMSRYLHYDKRGTGASDRLRGVPGLEERVDDMRTVMDHAGIERAHLLGNSDGGATALVFAATHPDRVTSLVLFGSGASTFPPEPSAARSARFALTARAFATSWGTVASPFVDRFAPSLARNGEFRRWHRRYERACCDSETLRDLLQMSWDTDVRGVLGDVRVPVLLLHRVDDRIVDVARSHEAAALLPDARVVELDGNDHLGYAGDRDAWLDEMERWLTGAVADRAADVVSSHPRARVVTLGRFAVEVDGQQVPTSAWGSRHARTIVKRLAVARGWPVTRDELFELLWPGEVDRAKVGARLSVQLTTVRRILRGGVDADRATVRLDLDEVELDLDEFGRAPDDGAVVAMHTGQFLPSDHDHAWTAATRAEVATRFAAAATRAAMAALEAGAPARAARVARRLLDDDPLNLRGHELLVAALLDQDQHTAAVAAHAAWSAAGDEVGVQVPPLDPV